jgi:hypothetical protein
MQDYRLQLDHWLYAINPDLKLDENDGVYIETERHSPILISLAEQEPICHLYAPLPSLPYDDLEALFIQALELNSYGIPLGGCWLAWENELNMLCLRYDFNLAHSDQVSFQNTIQNFISAITITISLFAENSSQLDNIPIQQTASQISYQQLA